VFITWLYLYFFFFYFSSYVLRNYIESTKYVNNVVVEKVMLRTTPAPSLFSVRRLTIYSMH